MCSQSHLVAERLNAERVTGVRSRPFSVTFNAFSMLFIAFSMLFNVFFNAFSMLLHVLLERRGHRHRWAWPLTLAGAQTPDIPTSLN